MSTSVSSVTNHFPSAENGFATTLAGAVTNADTTVYLASLAGYEDGEVVVFVVDPNEPTKKQTFTGVVDTATTTLTDVVWTAGTNQGHSIGTTVVDYATATHISMISKGLVVAHNQDGTHKASMVLVTPKVDTIGENTPANGVTVDGLNIKDGKLNTNDSVVTTNITDGAVTAAKIEEQQAWIAPTLSGTWVNYGAPYNNAGYYKDSLGMVHIRGLVKSGGSSTIFTLPAGYRPQGTMLGFTIANSALSRFDITSAGVLTVSSYSASWTSLENIHFRAYA